MASNVKILTIEDLADVLEATVDVQHLWQTVGLALKVSAPILDRFKKQHPNIPPDCYLETLKEWLNNVTDPTWEKMVAALRSDTVRQRNLANKIAEKHCPHIKSIPRTRAITVPNVREEKSANHDQISRSLGTDGLLTYDFKNTDALSLTAEGSKSGCATIPEKNPNRESTVETLKPTASSLPNGPTSQPFMLGWKKSPSKAPKEMYSAVDPVVHNGVAYFRRHRTERILQYDIASEKWLKLPKCNVEDTTLAIVNDLPTTVGGVNKDPASKTSQGAFTMDLFSLKDNEWRKVLPSMPTKRSQVTAVSTGNMLIIAGGRGHDGALTIVEALDLNAMRWNFVGDLPQACYRASSCVSDDYLYIIGGEREKASVKCVFRASISHFLTQGKVVFTELADLPLEDAACVSIRGKVLAIGGSLASKSSSLVHVYDIKKKMWQELKYPMIVSRCHCFAVAISDSKIMVVGGCTIQPTVGRTDSIEFADLIEQV